MKEREREREVFRIVLRASVLRLLPSPPSFPCNLKASLPEPATGGSMLAFLPREPVPLASSLLVYARLQPPGLCSHLASSLQSPPRMPLTT